VATERFATRFGSLSRSRSARGFLLLTEAARRTPIVALKVMIRRGYAHEDEGQAGLASLLMRMFLQGTLRRSAQQLQLELAGLGASLESGASAESSAFELQCTREVLPAALELLLEVIATPAFLESELKKEREQALQRIRARRDQYLESALDQFAETFYRGHPYHRPGLGYEETVAGLQVEDLRRAYEGWLTPANLVVAAVGDLEHERLLDRFEAGLPELPPATDALDPATLAPPERGSEAAFSHRESAQAWVVIGFPAAPLGHPDYPPLRLLNTVLGGSMSSRLFIEVREKRSLAYQVGSLYQAQKGPSYLAGYLGTTPAQYEQARATVEAELRRLALEPVPEEELEGSRRYLRGTTLLAQETNRARAARYASFEALGLGFDYGDRALEAALASSAEAAKEAAERHFTRCVSAAVMPTPGAEKHQANPLVP